MKAGRKVVLPACVVRKLEVDERVKSFNCGDADLNDFILYEAGAYQKALLAGEKQDKTEAISCKIQRCKNLIFS